MTALYTYEPIQSKPLHYILYGTLYLFLLLITNLTHHHEFVIPGLSLTVGYLFGMLLLHRYRDWIILVPMFYLIVNGVNTVLFDFCWKFTLNTALVFLAIVVGVHHTRKFRITIPDFTNMNEFIYFSLYCILILSLVTSFFTSTIYTIFDQLNFNFFFFWLHWWAADAAGVFVVTPLILLSRKLIVEKEFHFEKGRIVEPLITLAVAIVIWYVVFTSKQPNTLFKYYLGLSVLFWIAIRFTVRGLAFFSLIMALIAVFSPDLHHQNKSLSEIYFTHININLYLILTNFLAYTTSALLSERRIAYTIVKQKEEEFHNLYMNTPIGVCRASLDGIIQLANPAFCKLFGYAHDEIIGKNGLDLTHPEDKENFYHHMRLLLDGAQETFQMEKRCVQKNGGIIWADVSANLFKNEEGLPLGFNVHIQEITQQKLFHERLSASEKKFRELFEKSPTGILRTFADGRIESANESALKMLGYSHFDIAGKPFQEFIYPNDLEYANTILKNLQLGLLENAEFEARCIHKNKKLFWAKVHITSIYKMNSTIDFFIIQFTDITPLKNALRDLVESKEQFQTVFDDSPLMSTIVDAETSRFIEVNKRFLEVSGFTKEEVIGKTPSEIGWLTEEVRTKVLQEALAQGKILDLELSPTNKYGQTIYMRYNAVIIEIGGKKHLLSLAQDITELKQMTKRRWEAEQNYQKLYNSMLQGIVIQDKNGTILDCNPAAERILGRSRDQLIGDCTYTTEWNSIRENGEPYPIEDHPSQIALRTKQPVLNAIMGIRRLSDNQLIWISIDAIPEFIESDSEPQFVFVTFSDITAEILLLDHQKLTQKRLDATLRLTEYMYKSDEVFLRQVIEEVSTISESEHASLFLREKDDEPFKAIARSESQLQCQLCAKVAYLPLKENVWTKVIDTKRYIIVNDFDFEYPDSLPENHIKLQRALFVPILVENKVLGIVSVANKRLPYTQQDAEHLELFIATVWHMIEKRKAEAKLLETITTSATILDHLPSGFMLFEWDGARELSLVQLNHRTKEMLSISDEQIGKKFLELFSEGEDRGLIDAFIGVMTSGNPLFLNDLFYQDERIGGFFRVVAFPLPKNHLAILFDDITNLKRVEQEKKRLEDTLQQAQKMEAIGQLAGGVAHDFNNILQVIVGYTELAQLKLGISAFPNDEIELIQQAAERAKNLVHQLLTFSRRGEMNLEPHVLSDIVQSTTDLLKRLIGEQIELRLQIEERTPETLVDAGQIELILMNLCVNSRDAMPNGGKITIKVDTVFPSDTMLRQYPWAPVGKYVRISVSDTGTGIPPEILHRIFEPFFTTKSRGKGTGLGLATVYGIVRRHSGFITVNSQVGIGTRFDLYFPIIETIQTETTKKTGTQIKLFEVKGEGRKLLLAEDETDVRYVMKRILEQAGFVVYTASDGEEAMKVAEQYLHDLDAFILDGIMPKANGIEVFRFIRNLKPNAKVIFCTGYDFGTFELDESIYQSATVLQKPVSSDTLLMTVQEVLEP